MSTAKPSGIKGPSKIAKPGAAAPKTNPGVGKNPPSFAYDEHTAM